MIESIIAMQIECQRVLDKQRETELKIKNAYVAGFQAGLDYGTGMSHSVKAKESYELWKDGRESE